MHRCEPRGSSSTGLIHSRLALADLDNDGLTDLVIGCSRGGVVWYPNRGSRTQPAFPFSQLVFSDDKPLDVSWGSAPHAVDWNGDGLVDLIVGGERNRLLYFRNRGEKGRPKFEYAGLVTTADGQALELPVTPVPEGPDVYKLDYYPVVDTADWDADGDIDLLAGGFITGRVYLYENTAGPGREPVLRLAGPIEADGQPLDVQWAAAPAVADLDGDGDLDLMSGCMPMTAGGGDSASSETFLHYFRNDGTRQAPRLHEITFPRQGEFPRAALASPPLHRLEWRRPARSHRQLRHANLSLSQHWHCAPSRASKRTPTRCPAAGATCRWGSCKCSIGTATAGSTAPMARTSISTPAAAVPACSPRRFRC